MQNRIIQHAHLFNYDDSNQVRMRKPRFFRFCQASSLNVTPNSLCDRTRFKRKTKTKKKRILEKSHTRVYFLMQFNAKYWIYERTYISMPSPFFTLSTSIWNGSCQCIQWNRLRFHHGYVCILILKKKTTTTTHFPETQKKYTFLRP